MRDDTGHRTTTITRPRVPDERARRNASTRYRDADAPLVRRRRSKILVTLLAVVVAGSLAASVLILPVKAWLNQREELSNREQELSRLDAANDQLEADTARLETESGVIQAAREELGAVRVDEKVFRIVDDPQLSATLADALPEGWLFPTIGALLAARTSALVEPLPAIEPTEPTTVSG